MKIMILTSLISLIASGAYASDLSYGGPYSQMKLKLCSDTPPSRSILPDGSLVCDGEDNDPNAYCVGGFNYADTDIFNCGTQDYDSNDLNFNGIDDSEEDWDGDGLANGVDPNPTSNGQENLDSDGDGIPDSLKNFYDTIGRNTPEVIRCASGDDNCSTFEHNLRLLTQNNRELGEIIGDISFNNMTKAAFYDEMEDLSKGIYQQHQFTRRDIQLNRKLIQAKNTGGIDNSGIINSGFSDMRTEFKEVDSLFNQTLNRFDDVDYDLDSVDRSLTSLNGQINGVHGHLDATQSDIIDAINNSGGGIGLTSQQKSQLANASKAKNNQNLIKKLQTTVDNMDYNVGMVQSDMESVYDKADDAADGVEDLLESNARLEGALNQTQMMVSSIADDVNENTNQKFNQLSDQIAAISGGTSTVDLSGVETSIDGLSEKIDGVSSGVTDIGDLLKGVDASKAGIDGTCIQGDTCQGFYKSAYEGDLSDVVSDELAEMKTSIVDPFVSSFGNIDLSGAQRPKFGLPVPFYGYMSFDDYIDMDWIFGFLRFIFLASTAFYCRQIIFGG